MANGKYQRWLEPDGLEKLTNWAARGNTDAELANNMGISCSTFYAWLLKYSDISEAIKKGREMAVEAIENAFFKRALGGTVVTEEVEEFRGTFKDGKPWDGTGVKRTVRKELPGDVTAQIFYLKNKAGYRNEVEASVAIDEAPTFVYVRNADKRS